jgi:hypothetical protein
MDFYDEWGLWEEDIKMFLNTIKDKEQRTFTASFYFRCSSDPATLFAKTLLKMAKQSQNKGLVSIEVKPCQYLDTTRDIIFFNLPFCDAVGLWDYIKSARLGRKADSSTDIPRSFHARTGAEPFKISRWCVISSRILPGKAGRRRPLSKPFTSLCGTWSVLARRSPSSTAS